jgi:hypothetical protein
VIIASVVGLPSDELIEAVEDNLYNHELMAFDVQVKAPTVTDIDVDIEFTGDADEADVALVAESYVHDLGIGGRFAIRDLYALFTPLGLDTVEILTPDRDVQTAAASVIVAAITATKVAR